MTAAQILSRLRWFLLTLALLLFVGTTIELWLVNHTEDTVQWVPFILCGLAIIAILVTVSARGKKATFFLRVCMMLAIAGSGFGVYEHVTNNMAFEKEIHPSTAGRALLLKGLGGANPLLAPGMLGIAGLLALAATYKQSVTDEGKPADVLT